MQKEEKALSKGKRYDEPKLNLKKVFAVIILFVVIIMCIVMLKGILAGEEEKQEKITSIDYFSAYNNNKWGVINSNGDIVIDPSYAEMIIVPNSKKDIFLCTFDVNYDDGTYKTKALNGKNEEIFTSYEQIEAITNIDENQNLSYNGQVLRVQKQGKYGLINMDGTEILPCEYEEIKALQGVENAILVQKEGKYGIVNNEGKTLIEPNYVEIQGLGKEASQGFIVKNQEEKYGIIDISNKQVLETKYDAISKIHKGDYYVVTENGKQKVVKKDGTEILNGEYDEIVAILKNPENGIIYKDNEKYGLMNLEGTKIIAENYDCYVIKPYNIRYFDNNDMYMKEHYLSTIFGAKRYIWDSFCNVILELHPEYSEILKEFSYGNSINACNMFIMKKSLFFEYSAFCFDVLKELDKRVDTSKFTKQEQRFLGYLAEYLLTMYVMKLQKERKRIKYLDALLFLNMQEDSRLKKLFSKILTVENQKYHKSYKILGIIKLRIRKKNSIYDHLQVQDYMLKVLTDKVTELQEQIILNNK